MEQDDELICLGHDENPGNRMGAMMPSMHSGMRRWVFE